MSFESEYFALVKKRKEEERKAALQSAIGSDSFSDEYLKLQAQRITEEENRLDNAFAPLRKNFAEDDVRALISDTQNGNVMSIDEIERRIAEDEKTEDDEGLDFFDSGAFSDGYDFGDITKSILGTAGDAAVAVGKGAVSLVEGITDLGGYAIAGVGDLFGADEFADDLRKDVSESYTEKIFGAAQKYLDQYSLLGETTVAVGEAAGQIGSIVATGGALGLTGGAASAFSLGLMGTSGVGSGMSEAYQGGATDGEALTYGLISGAADVFTEMIFGGLGKSFNALGFSKGLSSADDILAKKIGGMFKSTIGKNIAEVAVKSGAEGLEEVLAGGLQAVGKKLTYMSERDLSEIVADENLLQQFVVGSLASGIMQTPGAVKTTKSGKDYISGLNQNEQTVVDKVVEKRIVEAEKDGNKLTNSEKNKIYDAVVNDMNKGYISISDIEEALGGDTYSKLSELTKKEAEDIEQFKKMYEGEALQKRIDEYLAESKKGELQTQLSDEVYNLVSESRLSESYNEKMRSGVQFSVSEETLAKYEKKYRGTFQRAMESGVLNNTRRAYELVELVAKLEADKGAKFDFANNKKLAELGYTVEGATVNGVVDADGNIKLNVESNKYLNTVAGHEIAHVLEGTDLYDTFKSAVFEYAKTKGEYDSRYAAIDKLYGDKEGYKGQDGQRKIENELAADLVGDYLFTDADFIKNLSTKHRNLFEKIYDEIKYLYKTVTAGSKEARQLEKVKKAFEDAYRADTTVKTNESTAPVYSLSDPKADQKYLDAVKRGDTETAKKMVEDAAKESGYTVRAMHGTNSFGFTVADVTMSDDGISFFATDADETALSYSSGVGKKQIADAGKGIDAKSLESVKADVNKLVSDYMKDGYYLVGEVKWADVNEISAKVDEIFAEVEKGVPPAEVAEKLDAYLGELEQSLAKAYYNDTFQGIMSYEQFLKSEEMGKWPEKIHEVPDKIRDVFSRVESWSQGGVYDLFVNTDGHLVIDAKGSNWDNISADNLPKRFGSLFGKGDGTWNTRNLAKYAKRKGYTGVTFKNLVDSGNAQSVNPATVYVFFNPQAQVKSADAVTYDDNGDVIPLSERFNKKNADMRYSLSDSDGKQLTEGQQTFFQNSKMRDENGNLKVMYHGSQDAGFHVFDSSMSDDGTSFFFVDRNDVAASYSGTTETYEARTIRTAEDMNNFLAEIGYDQYEATEKDGKFELLENGEHITTKDTAQEIYEEFCWYEGVGEGDANYKVYLNLTNPLEIDAKGKNWNNISREYSQEVADRYNSLTDSEKTALAEIAEWGEYGIFRDEILSMAKAKANGKYHDADLASAYEKLGGANANLYDAFSIASDNFSAESINEFAVKQMNTRDYAKKAKAEGYDGVIFKNIVDIGGHGGDYTPATVAIAFDSNQIKSVANENPTENKDIRHSLSKQSETPKKYGNLAISGEDVRYKGDDISPVAEKPHVSMEEFANNESSVWRNVDYNDNSTKTEIMRETHRNMVGEGVVATIPEDVSRSVDESFPDLRGVKKKDRTPILKETMRKLKDNLRQFLNGFKNQGFEFEVNGRVLDAKLYNTGINEVLEKITKDKANMLYTTEEIFRNARYLYSTEDYSSDPNVYRWNYFYTPVQIGDSVVGVRIAVRDLVKQGESQIYNWGIKKDTSLDGAGDDFENRKSNGVSSDVSENIIPQNGRFVKSQQDTDALFEEWKTLRSVKNRTEAQNLRMAELKAQISAHERAEKTTANVNGLEGVLADDIAPLDLEAQMAMNMERLNSLTDEDVPPLPEEPYYGESEATQKVQSDPFEKRDFYSIGADRKAKAYMYDNPEVKPFFQQAAREMLTDLNNSEKAERGVIKDQDGYIEEWYGLPRNTTDDIAYLLDNTNDSYEDIRRGLTAIIEDHGRENNAASKRIEFVLHQRLTEGYTDIFGYETPANQDYINLLNRMNTAEDVNQQGAKSAMFTDADAPIQEAVIKEGYEAVRPKPQKKAETGGRLVRVKDDSAPIAPNMEERSWYETSSESEAVNGAVKPDDIPNELRYYQVKHNKNTLEAANFQLNNMGYEKAVTYFEGKITDKKVSVEDVALGERLIQEAVKKGDIKTATDLIVDISILGTELGQRVQALSIIKKLSPEGQLKALHKVVERGKAKGDKAFRGVEISEEMSKRILETRKSDGSFDQNELNRAVEDVKQQLADKMSVSFGEKANAWRYFSMLGNPKTHIRNIVSNIANFATRSAKNVVARTAEDVFLRNATTNNESGDISPVNVRTKTWKRSSDAVKTYAKQITAEEADVISGGNKYSDMSEIKQNRRIFKNKILHGVTEFNSNAMEKEDAWFSRPTYERAFAEYLTANGIATEADIQKNPELVEKAKNYALDEAKAATFRQDSYLANKISEIEQKNAVSGIIVGSVMPFKRTPINIAKAGVAYSPIGLARGLYDVAQARRGNIDMTTAIDRLAQGLTGTSLALLGYALASMGVLNGAGEDDKEGKYDYQLGKQAYSVTIGGKTYSLSWLTPVSMPLFVGANLYEGLVGEKEWDFDMVTEALGQTLDPLSEMSFLSSLDDVLSSYDSGMARVWGAGESLLQNYVTQYVPTFSSQVAAVMDDTKRSTRPSRDSGASFLEETWNKVKYKVPGLRNTLEPTTDIWGNDVEQNQNLFANFLAPWNEKSNIATDVDEELKVLYGETGLTEILPSIPYNYTNYKGEKYEMSAKEHTAYKKAYGQIANELLAELFKTNTYKYGDSELRAQMVRRVYDYARDEANKAFFSGRNIAFTNAEIEGRAVYKEDSIKGAIEHDMTIEEYNYYAAHPDKYTLAKALGGFSAFKSYSSYLYDIKADKDSSGKSINGSRKEKVLDYINNLDADYGEKIILFKSEYPSDDTYNYEIIEYLNGRDDISYSEMETILKELGFTVYPDGRISW